MLTLTVEGRLQRQSLPDVILLARDNEIKDPIVLEQFMAMA